MNLSEAINILENENTGLNEAVSSKFNAVVKKLKPLIGDPSNLASTRTTLVYTFQPGGEYAMNGLRLEIKLAGSDKYVYAVKKYKMMMINPSFPKKVFTTVTPFRKKGVLLESLRRLIKEEMEFNPLLKKSNNMVGG